MRLGMLRKIQLASTWLSAIFGFGALFDVFFVQGNATTTLFPGWRIVPVLTGGWITALALLLTIVPLFAIFSITRSRNLMRDTNVYSIDVWRRMTWGISIIETAGCLLFAVDGSLLYLPSAVALLITGVAELATILNDVESRTSVVTSHPLHGDIYP